MTLKEKLHDDADVFDRYHAYRAFVKELTIKLNDINDKYTGWRDDEDGGGRAHRRRTEDLYDWLWYEVIGS